MAASVRIACVKSEEDRKFKDEDVGCWRRQVVIGGPVARRSSDQWDTACQSATGVREGQKRR